MKKTEVHRGFAYIFLNTETQGDFQLIKAKPPCTSVFFIKIKPCVSVFNMYFQFNRKVVYLHVN